MSEQDALESTIDQLESRQSPEQLLETGEVITSWLTQEAVSRTSRRKSD